MAINKLNPVEGGVPKGDTANRSVEFPSPSIGDVYYNGQLEILEIWNGTSWVAVSAPPATPSIATPTDSSTTDAYTTTAGKLTVVFTPGSGGGTPNQYNAYTTSGGFSGYSSNSTVTISGLTPGTAYTLYGNAQNNFGTTVNTGNSAAVTPTTLPGAPTIGTASDAGTGGALSLTFTAGATGGKAITNYQYSTDGSTYNTLSPAQTTSPLTIPGLTNGTAYTVRIKAVNANGSSPASSASNSATPSLIIPVDFLVIAGGGGGGGGQPGAGVGAGGGAGGYRTSVGTSGANSASETPMSIVAGENFTVTVGAGGTGSLSMATPGNASNSVLGTITSTRGGYGQPGNASNGAPSVQNGGSGGGGGQGPAQVFGSGTASQGNNGGSNAGTNQAGGGGGAGAVGSNGANGSPGGNGGDGLSNSITGTSVTRAGGGGGGRHAQNTSGNSVGGAGGGGASTGASSGTSSSNGSAGTVNTGSGGGGGGENGASFSGGNGGSGVVIIKYPNLYSISGGTGLTFTTSTAVSGYKVTTFTAGTGTVAIS